jgi:hypothetical protein
VTPARAVPTRGDDPPQPPAVPARGDDPPQPPAVPARGDHPPQPPAVPARGDHPPQPPAVRAGRLLRWYPRSWRARYGEEFTELLTAELAERPRSPRRTVNVVCSGLRARLADAGFTSHPLEREATARAGLATLACCGAVFALFGGAMWSQLAIGLQWAKPRHQGITQALDLMSIALLVFAMLTVLAILGVARVAVAAIRAGHGRALLRPATMIMTGAAVLFAGARHFENGWPGTGGHLLFHQGLVPPGVAAFCWATTMWITSYLAHPQVLGTFPAAQLTWMALSPAAACCLIFGTGQFLRRLDRSPGVLRYETWLARAATAAMILYIGAALRWLASPGTGVMPAFHVGSIDVAAMAVLVLAVVAGGQAIRGAELARSLITGASGR